jgi:Amt family ammonium transporter
MIPGHHMGYVFLGGMILWLGWFGFNPGSTMSVDPEAISRIAVTTNLAACAGTLTATLYAWWRHGYPDFSLTVNGCLAGLVSITAPCAYVTPEASIIIGAIAGVSVIEATKLFDRAHVDDPVGATSVHLVHGIFGTLCVGLFGVKGMSGLPHDGLLRGGGFSQLWPQAEAVLAVGAFSFGSSYVVWLALKRVMGLRVTAEQEEQGLDLAEMGMEAYPDSRQV